MHVLVLIKQIYIFVYKVVCVCACARVCLCMIERFINLEHTDRFRPSVSVRGCNVGDLAAQLHSVAVRTRHVHH